jgi:alpha-glucosidase
MIDAYHHDGSIRYVSTLAPSLAETVTVFLRGPNDATRVYVRSTPDGEPQFTEAVVDRAYGDETWWRADIVAHNPVTCYRFLIYEGTDYRWLTAYGLVDWDVPDDSDFRLVVGPGQPAWADDAIVYQIFPDRFARSAAAASRPIPDWALPCDWDTPVIVGRAEAMLQLYGGDLDGIAERLDHIESLGANTLYLTPIYSSRSNHRYDASSFDHVDPVLGGDDALARLAGAAHRRGMRLVGDITTNHTGDSHEWFTSADRAELYYVNADGSYESWLGVPSLPKLNWGSAELRRRFFSGEDAIAARWLSRSLIDGWRVDVANMTGRLRAEDRAHEIARLMANAVRAANPDALLIAEHAHDASQDLDRGGWHGTMNYAGFTRPVLSWLLPSAGGPGSLLDVPGSLRRRDGAQAVATIRAFASRVSWRSRTASWNVLGTHDTARVRSTLGSAESVEAAAGLLTTLPGTPMIFAGDEWGMLGENGEDSRRPMPWRHPQTWDRATYQRYQALLRLRRSAEALRHGGLRFACVTADAIAFWRETPGQRLLVLVRRAPGDPLTVHLGQASEAENLYGSAPLPISDGKGKLPGDGPGVQIWQVHHGLSG